MIAYRKERIENAILYFVQEHHRATGSYPTPEALYKYLALFEFRYVSETGDMPLELEYQALPNGPLPTEIHTNRDNYRSIRIEPYRGREETTVLIKPVGSFDPDYFAEAELELMKNLIAKYAEKFTAAKITRDVSHKTIKAWKKAYKRQPGSKLNPADEFDKPIEKMSSENATAAELRFYENTQIRNFCLSPKKIAEGVENPA